MALPQVKIAGIRTIPRRDEFIVAKLLSRMSLHERYLLQDDVYDVTDNEVILDPSPFMLWNVGVDANLIINFITTSTPAYVVLKQYANFQCFGIKSIAYSGSNPYPSSIPNSFPLSSTDYLILASFHE